MLPNEANISLLEHQRPDLSTLPLLNWFDNSRLESFARCNRYGYYSDILGLDSAKAVMHAGTVMHHALEKGSEVELVRKWNEFKTWFTDSPQFTVSRILEVYNAYQVKWATDPLNILAHEFKLAYYLFDLDAWLIGRCDGIIYKAGKLWPLERKTCGGIRADYINDKNVSNQRLQYLFILSMILKDKGLNPRDYLGGMVFDIIGWNKTKMDFLRWDALLPNRAVFDEWLAETKDLISQYRNAMAKSEKGKLPNKRRAQCHIYGKCAFFDLCGAWELTTDPNPPAIVNNFRKKSWRPF